MDDMPTSPSPPPRPNKSRLRKLSSTDQHTSSSSSSSSSTHSDELPVEHQPKYISRFKENFDAVSTQRTDLISELVLPTQKKSPPKRPDALKPSKSFTAITSPLTSPSFVTKKMPRLTRASLSSTQLATIKDLDDLGLPPDYLMSTTTKRASLNTSLSTPLQRRNMASSDISLSSSSSTKLSSHSSHSVNTNSLSTSYNRADILITRLECWYQFLKSVTGWLNEVSKIVLQSSRGFFQRAYPHLDESAAFTVTTALDNKVTQNVNQTIFTVQAGFQALTMQIAAEQQEFSKHLETEHLSSLRKLRKEVKEKIQKLKNDPALSMDELLRLAETTRSKMVYLKRCCRQASMNQRQAETDPWVANLLVLRHLKKEIDEENRLRLLMVSIQKDIRGLETRLIEAVKPAIRFCYQVLAPGAWDGSADKDTTPFQVLLDQIVPQQEWSDFAETHKKELVDEDRPIKDYLKINYPNKSHPLVMTLMKGKMERKFGVRKQFTERMFVLSQGGYLHQFSLDNRVTPEKTLYVPACRIGPLTDVKYHQTERATTNEDTSNTFEIYRPANNVLQRDKTAVFRTSSPEELIAWCRMLSSVANGANQHQSSYDNISLETGPTSLYSAETKSNSYSHLNSISSSVSSQSNLHSVPSSPAQIHPTEEPVNSSHSVHIEKMSKPLIHTALIEKEESVVTDNESFVTARLQENDSYDDEDYFIFKNEQADILNEPYDQLDDDDDDNISIETTSTAKGHTSVCNETLEPSVRKSPSCVSTIYDDSQSSLYFSSTSAPPSPSLSNRSSVVSIPEFHLLPGAMNMSGPSTANPPLHIYKAALSNINFDTNT
ncbi:Phosphatidylinositol 4,5-bisphosphate-binding protein SLM2 [Choanephora cucurbitarum]|uniref:Phosphatidylinositol 4,5-bisphosphate-binding protein SLM2 n=1 Tax=Choanephora cucurbitarum TaxID=101091 RepID=A0A1C7NEL4_9FUNG|nr:Phosphatidylinositol 4,5-bisphosphate-binding protein SLM2 [Choanephora cucurbitarum]